MARFKANTAGGHDLVEIQALRSDDKGWFVHNPSTGIDTEIKTNGDWKAAVAAARRMFPRADIRLDF